MSTCVCMRELLSRAHLFVGENRAAKPNLFYKLGMKMII